MTAARRVGCTTAMLLALAAPARSEPRTDDSEPVPRQVRGGRHTPTSGSAPRQPVEETSARGPAPLDPLRLDPVDALRWERAVTELEEVQAELAGFERLRVEDLTPGAVPRYRELVAFYFARLGGLYCVERTVGRPDDEPGARLRDRVAADVVSWNPLFELLALEQLGTSGPDGTFEHMLAECDDLPPPSRYAERFVWDEILEALSGSVVDVLTDNIRTRRIDVIARTVSVLRLSDEQRPLWPLRETVRRYSEAVADALYDAGTDVVDRRSLMAKDRRSGFRDVLDGLALLGTLPAADRLLLLFEELRGYDKEITTALVELSRDNPAAGRSILDHMFDRLAELRAVEANARPDTRHLGALIAMHEGHPELLVGLAREEPGAVVAGVAEVARILQEYADFWVRLRRAPDRDLWRQRPSSRLLPDAFRLLHALTGSLRESGTPLDGFELPPDQQERLVAYFTSDGRAVRRSPERPDILAHMLALVLQTAHLITPSRVDAILDGLRSMEPELSDELRKTLRRIRTLSATR